MNWKKQNGKEVLKQGRKILGFVGTQSGIPFYAFGKPSQDMYISFSAPTIESAKEMLLSKIQPSKNTQ